MKNNSKQPKKNTYRSVWSLIYSYKFVVLIYIERRLLHINHLIDRQIVYSQHHHVIDNNLVEIFLLNKVKSKPIRKL